MKKICIIGHFGNNKNLLNGQTIKTKTITKGIKDILGNNEVYCVDTYNGKKRIVPILFQIIHAFRKCEKIIMMPAHNGVKFFSPLSGRDELEIPVKAKIDGDYVLKRGFFYDIGLIIKTAFKVFKHDGIVEGGTGQMNKEKMPAEKDNQK